MEILSGMGAIPYDGGVAFRVWAPHASEVSVVGDFNDWDASRDPLLKEFNGNWYAAVPGVRPGAEYRFVLRTAAGDELNRIDPYALQVTNSVGNGIVYDHDAFDWEGDDFTCPNHNELVIYETHVGSFAPADGGVGTLAEVRAKLGHLTELGINAIQLMPVAEFAGDFSWGYNPAHPFAVESGYGGPDALKTLVREAHKIGIAVIIDVVYNHFGPSDLDLWQFDGWSPGESGKGGIYFYNDDRSATPWGDTRPDYGRPQVRDYLRDNALMWLRDYRADGLRFDMTLYIRSIDASGSRTIDDGWDLMSWLNRTIRDEFPDCITIAEDLQGLPAVTSTGEGGAAFHAQWDSHFVHPVREAIITPDDQHRSMQEVAEAVTASYGDAFARVVYTESHDEVANGKARVPYEVNSGDPEGWHAQKRSTLGAALMFTAPGIPMLFQGQEFLQGSWFQDTVPLDWANNESFQGIVRLYRDLIHLRRNVSGVSKGLLGQHVRICHADEAANIIAYHRWMDGGPGDDVVVVVNLSAQEVSGYRIGLPAAGRWEVRLNSDSRSYSPHFGDATAYQIDATEEGAAGMPAGAVIDIAPYSVLVYCRSGE